MPGKIKRLESLVQLAKEPSGDKRRELLRDVADLFLEEPEKLNEREVDYFSDIIGKVAFDLEMEVRKDLAERMAGVNWAPRSLLVMLANDKIEVARPILTESGVLHNADLIDIIKRHSQEHLVAISLRKSISEDVTDFLVDKGDDTVLKTLAGNEGAVLSRKSMERMTERSVNNEDLHEPLVMRKDMPADLKHEMFLYVSSALRKHILSTIEDVDETEIDKLLEESRSKLDVPAEERAVSPAEQFIIRKERMNRLNPALLVQLLRQGRIAEFVAGVAHLAKMDVHTAHKITFDDGGETLAVVCKAVGIDRTTFSDLLLLTNLDGSRTQADRDALLDVYGKITMESAQRAIRFWRTRKQMMQGAENAYNAPARR